MDYSQGCRVQGIKMHAGVGTHMDAPNHFIEYAQDIASIPLSQLIVPGHVLNVSAKANQNYVITPEDIQDYEKKYGNISANSLFIGYTGWSQKWDNPAKYRNEDAQGNMRFPGFSKQAAQLLLERNIAGLGIDTLSPDGADMSFPVHTLVLGQSKYLIENIAHADKLPARNFHVIALPLNVVDGTESAIRLVGIVQN